MTAEHDDVDGDFESWPAEVDPLTVVFADVFVAIMENTAEGSRERVRAMSEALEAHRRIVDAMRDRRTLN
jgi:hypothetical protein